MAETPQCPTTGHTMIRAEKPLTVRYKDKSTLIAMPGWYCDASGESVHSREDMRVSDRALIALKADVENLASPEEVRRIRTSLGLSQVEAGRVLGGGPRAFQKYESGEVLTSRAMTNLLRSLERHPEDISRMRDEAKEAQEVA